ncbi:MAG: excisionase family DNA binding protein [Chlamydiales bacterium]|jgi:excisionase family DNA binding protein
MISSLVNDRTLSPRELARALGVSESSVKRWIDAGRVQARLTAGGHRRVELLPALRFFRDSGRELADPSVLGLEYFSRQALDDDDALSERIFELLRAGHDGEVAEAILTALVFRPMQPADLFDGPVRTAMARIGSLWADGQQGIYVEHRATQILLRIMDQIDALFEPPADGLIAMGGSIDGDPSVLPSRMASTVLASEGFCSVNLGGDIPAAAFLEAADKLGAQIVWVSVSYVSDVRRQSHAVTRLVDQLAERGLSCILGGREIHRLQLSPAGKARVGLGMQELATLARQVQPAAVRRVREG